MLPGSVRMTERQGQVLSFIFHYELVNGGPPAQADIQAFFGISGPAVHQMIVTLERKGLLARVPGVSRAIRVLVPRAELPELQPSTSRRPPPGVRTWVKTTR
ncbi:MAG: MarR family transcriptional regulator [Armatimonadetes bacterium]|nr:MarR family transcriptional regulator [Armatimonadota bacterium]